MKDLVEIFFLYLFFFCVYLLGSGSATRSGSIWTFLGSWIRIRMKTYADLKHCSLAAMTSQSRMGSCMKDCIKSMITYMASLATMTSQSRVGSCMKKDYYRQQDNLHCLSGRHDDPVQGGLLYEGVHGGQDDVGLGPEAGQHPHHQLPGTGHSVQKCCTGSKYLRKETCHEYKM